MEVIRHTMNAIDVTLILAGLLAAGAISAVCGVGLVVWLAGGKSPPPE